MPAGFRFGFGMGLGSTSTGGGGGPVPYLGPVASKTYIPNFIHASMRQVQTRTRHIATEDITSLKIAVPNFAVVSLVETGVGSAMTVTASVEYPVGTLTQIKFSGVAQGSTADKTILFSDLTNVVIPKGAWFFIKMYCTSTAGIPLLAFGQKALDDANGEVVNYAASGVVDQTMSTSTTSGGDTNNGLWPVAVLGMTTKPTVYLLQDSRGLGLNATMTANGFNGTVAPKLSPLIGTINGCVGGQKAENWASSQPLQEQLIATCSHVLNSLAINDLPTGRTAAQVEGYNAAALARFPTKIPVNVTTEPISTGSWGSAGAQSAAIWNSERVALNVLQRAKPICWDITAAVENSLNDGLWKSPGYTADGTHETTLADLAIYNSGEIDPAELVYV